MAESAGMDIYVRRKGIDEATVSLERLSRTAGKAEEQAKKLGYFFDKQGRLRHSNGQFAKSNDEVANSLRKLAKETKQASQANDGLSGSVANTGTAMEAAKKIAAGYFTFTFVKRAIAMADAMTSMNAQIRLVTASQDEAAIVQERLLSISNRTYSSLEATTTLYTRAARALKDANKSQAEFLTFSEAINNAMRLGGVGANEQTNALLQLSQALGSGVLQGDEFRSIAENAPILLDLVAKELGVVRGEVKALASEGKITSEVIFNALTNASAQLAKDAATMPITVAQAVNVAKNELNIFADAMLNGTGVTSYMADAIILLSKNVNMVLIPAIGVGAVMAVRALASSLVSLGMVGGPIAAAVSMLGLLAMAWDKNSRKIEEMNSKIEAAHTGVNSMVREQLDKHKQDINIAINVNIEELEKASISVIDLEKDIERQQSLVDRTSGSRRAGNLATLEILKSKLVVAKNLIVDLRGELAKLDGMQGEISNAERTLNINDRHGPIRELAGPFKTADDAAIMKVFADIDKAQNKVVAKTIEQTVRQKILNKEYGQMSEEAAERAILEAKNADLMALQANNTATVESMMEELRIQAEKTGMSVKEAFLFDLARSGDGVENITDIIKEASGLLDEILSKTPSGGKSTIDHYNDRLQDMSRELSQVLSLNRELENTGYTSQYNAVSQITLELNDQASTLYKISDAQKQVLIGQAQQIDAANQLNAIMSLGTDYTKRIEDLAFENELMGKSAQQIEAMRFAYELESQAKLLSIGMSKENIAILEEEIQKYLELYDLVQKARGEKENSIGGGIQDGMQRYVDSVGNMRDQFADATMSTLGHMENFLFDFATTGKASFRDMTVSILQDISKMMIRMAMMQAVQSAMSMFSGGGLVGNSGGAVSYPYRAWTGGHIPEYATGGKVIDFSGGGFTGDGGKFEPKGIVHGGEFVMSKAAVNTLGIGYLEHLHNSAKSGAKGYANGGIVGGAPSVPGFPRNQQSQQKSGDIIINQTIHYQGGKGDEDGKEVAQDFSKGLKGELKRLLKDEKRPGGILYR